MPVQLSYPGVYIQEISSGTHTITGVPTAITAFVGRAAKGPTNVATLITSYAEYERTFGGLASYSTMSFAVRDYYLNGGNMAVIVRLFNEGSSALAAKTELEVSGLKFEAATEGSWGNALRITLDTEILTDIHKDMGVLEGSVFNLQVFDANTNQSESYSNLTVCDHANRVDKVLDSQSSLIRCQDTDFVTLIDNYITNLLDAITDAATEVGEVVTNINDAAVSASIEPEFLTDDEYLSAVSNLEKAINALEGHFGQPDVLDNEDTRKSVIETTPFDINKHNTAIGDLKQTVVDLYPLTIANGIQSALNTIEAQREAADETQYNAAVAALNTIIEEYEDHPGMQYVAEAEQARAEMVDFSSSAFDEDAYDSALAALNAAISELALSLVLAGKDALTTAEEDLDDLLNETGYTQDQLNAAKAVVAAAESGLTGNDGDVLADENFRPNGARTNKEGLYALEQADLFTVLCIPPHTHGGSIETQLVGAAAAYCEEKRAFLVVDPPEGWTTPTKARTGILNTTDEIGTRSQNAAIFWPRLKQPNPFNNDVMEEFVSCGVVAGVMARTDSERGVWKAPAGLDAQLKNVPDLAYIMTDGENGTLNPIGINALRYKSPVGRVVYGARTLAGDDRLASEWKYIPVRRTALFIEESLYRGTQWVVFEPNDEDLWAQIRLNLGSFMHGLFRKGAFQGQTPDVAYFVKCDSETTTQEDIDLGIVNIVVGFAPLKPAEFVVISLQQYTAESQS